MSKKDEIQNTSITVGRLDENKQGYSITQKHKAVIRNLALGMGKAKSWISVHPNCKYLSNAYACVKKLMMKDEAQRYYQDLVEEQNNFIDENNMISLNGVGSVFRESLVDAQMIINVGKSTKDYDMVAKGISLKAKLINDYAKVMGKGTYKKESKKESKRERREREIEESEKEVINVTPLDEKLKELMNGGE